MRDIKPECSQQAVPFVPGGEDALSHVAAASRLRSRVPARPPVDGQVDEERDRRHPHRVEVREEGKPRLGLPACSIELRNLQLEGIDPPDGLHGEDSQQNDHPHFQNELEKIGHQYAP